MTSLYGSQCTLTLIGSSAIWLHLVALSISISRWSMAPTWVRYSQTYSRLRIRLLGRILACRGWKFGRRKFLLQNSGTISWLKPSCKVISSLHMSTLYRSQTIAGWLVLHLRLCPTGLTIRAGTLSISPSYGARPWANAAQFHIRFMSTSLQIHPAITLLIPQSSRTLQSLVLTTPWRPSLLMRPRSALTRSESTLPWA